MSKKEEILRAAEKLFSAKGYDSASMRDIASVAEITPASIYYHFKNKQEILQEIYVDMIEYGLKAVSRISYSDKPADEKMRAIIREHVASIVKRQAVWKIFFHEEEKLPPDAFKSIREGKRRYNKIIEEVYAEGIREGLFKPTSDTGLLINAILGMSIWPYKWHKPDKEYDPEKISQQFIELLEDGYYISEKKELTKVPVTTDSEKKELPDSDGRIEDIVSELQSLTQELDAILKRRENT
ncbi:MAG: TetR/AcrR family transcriptional regulator [Pseudomonadota bacterium]